MQVIKKLFLFLFVFAFFYSCRKATTANWDVDLVLPVTNSKLNVSNFVGDTILKPDNTGLFHFILNSELAAVKLDSLLKLPDTTVINSFPWPLNDYTLTPGQLVPLINAPNETKFDLPNGIQLKRIDIRKSILSVKFSNTISQPVDIIFSLPNISKNGQQLLIKETVPTGTNSLVKSYDLAGYTINMQGANGKVFNTIVQNFSLNINPNAATTVVKFGQGLSMQVGYTDVIPEYIEGYFGQQTIVLPSDTNRIDFFKDFSAANFMLSEANIKFSVVNEIGADFSGSIQKLSSFNSLQKKNVVLNNTQLNRMNINAARKINTSINASTLAVTFNTLNSNATAFISNFPDKLSYMGTVNINPIAEVKNYGQFAYYNTGIRLIADIDIPLRFTANYFSLINETKINYSEVKQLNDFNYGNFVITATNSFPFAAHMQAYLLNENKQIIDSLLLPGSNTIGYGQLDNNNMVVKEALSVINVPFNRNKIKNLQAARYVLTKAKVILPPNPPEIKIYENYKLDIGIVAELNYNAKLSR